MAPLSLKEKLKALNLDPNKKIKLTNLPIEYINTLYKKHGTKPKKVKKVNPNPRVSPDDPRYKVFIKFINKLLIALKHKPINKLTEFKEIPRDDIKKKSNMAIFNDMEKEILSHFDKTACHYYHRYRVQYYAYTLIKTIAKMLGYTLIWSRKEINKSDGFRRTVYYYTIV